MTSQNSSLDAPSPARAEIDQREATGEPERLTTQVAKGAGIAFIGYGVRIVSSFCFNILLGRILGRRAYGLYALGRSVVSVVQPLSSLGLDRGSMRLGSVYRGEGNRAHIKGVILSSLGISLVSRVFFSAVLFSLAGIISAHLFNEPDLTHVLQIFALMLPLYIFTGVAAAVAQSFRRIEYEQAVVICQALLHLGLVGLAFRLGYRLAEVMHGLLIAAVLGSGIACYFLWKTFPEIGSGLRPSYEIRRLLSISLPMAFVTVAYVLLNYIDRFMLGYFRTEQDVGIYNAAAFFAAQMPLFINAINPIFSPVVADLHNKERYPEIESLYKTVTRWILMATLPLFLLFLFFPTHIMGIFGAEYKVGSVALTILSIAFLIGAGTGPGGQILHMRGKQNIDALNNVALIIVNVLLNLWLIPPYGILGAAIVTAIGLVLLHTVRFLEVYQLYKMTPYESSMLKPISAAIIAAFVTLIFQHFANQGFPIPFYLQMFLMLSVYGFTVFRFGLAAEDKLLLSNVIGRITRIG
jgi:O-antigen/teichoic acid export membrane protein